tara:strand:- start:7906 stop:9111 length:1206 start_codon:yes stop_codon:yes gene_type:complete
MSVRKKQSDILTTRAPERLSLEQVLPSLAGLSFAPTGAPQGSNTEESTSSMGKLIQLVIVLDCTASMTGPMDKVKEALMSVINEMHAMMTPSVIDSGDMSKKITVQFSLITYRDYGEMLPACSEPLEFGGPDAVRAAIEMEVADGGNDWPECVELALHYAETKLKWDDSANKMMLLVTDAPPHAQGGVEDNYASGPPSQYMCPDIWTTVDLLAKRGVCMTVCGCGDFSSYSRTPTIYDLMARKTNGRLVQFEKIQSSLASYLGTAALEEDFVQNVLERVNGMNLVDDAYDNALQDAILGMGDMFRSLSSPKFSAKTFFDVAKFDGAKNSGDVKEIFQSLGAEEIEHGGVMGGVGAGVFRSLGDDDGEDPPAKAMRSAAPLPNSRSAHVTTTLERLSRRRGS